LIGISQLEQQRKEISFFQSVIVVAVC
jgi:hypothetical protein